MSAAVAAMAEVEKLLTELKIHSIPEDIRTSAQFKMILTIAFIRGEKAGWTDAASHFKSLLQTSIAPATSGLTPPPVVP